MADTAAPPGGGGASMECNVCFEHASEPVVTFCGHLFCWPCLYRWLNSGHDQCPVCKSTVTDETIIPLYGRDAARPSTSSTSSSSSQAAAGAGGASAGPGGGVAGAAEAPAPQRNVPRRPAPRAPAAAARGAEPGPQLHFSAGIGFFPSLFGLQFQVGEINTPRHSGPLTREEQQQQLVSRTLLFLAVMLFFGLLFI